MPTAVVAPPDLGCLIYGGGAEGEPAWLLEGGHLRRVVRGAGWPYISPDGRSMVQIRSFPNEIWLTSDKGQREERLYAAPIGSPLVHGWNWAPDGAMGIFKLGAPASPASQDPGSLWRLDVPAGTAEQLVEEGAHWPLGQGTASRYRLTRLYLALRDGRGEVALPESGGSSPGACSQLPCWSPDGRWLFVMDSAGTPSLVDTQGPALRPLEVQVVYGWLDASHYLASYIEGEDLERYYAGEEIYVGLFLCTPPEDCQFLAQMKRSSWIGHSEQCP